jgi:hypothetical protein
MRVTFGIKIFTSVIVALPQDKLSTTNALAQHQLPSGTEILASVQLEPLDQTVFSAQPQDSGMETTVFAPRTESGTAKTVFALKDSMDLNASHAQPQDSGTTLKANVSAHKTEFGAAKIAFALQDFLDLNAFHAQLQDSGTII